MGLEELLAIPIFMGITGGDVLAGAAVGAAVTVASEGISDQPLDPLKIAEGAAIGGVAVPVASAAIGAVGDAIATTTPEVAGEVGDVLSAEAEATITPVTSQIPTAADQALADEVMAPLQAGSYEVPVATPEDIIQQSVAMEGGAGTLAEATAMAESSVGAETPLGALLNSLGDALPGAKQFFGGLADGKLNIPAMIQVLTATIKLLGPVGPGISKFLSLHTKTAERHIPAMLGTLQLMLGRFTQNPTKADKGIQFNLRDIQDALNVMGVRFSPDEDLADDMISTPLGNVIWDGTALNTKAISDIPPQIEQQSAVLSGTISELLNPERYPAIKTLMDHGVSVSSLLQAVGDDVKTAVSNYNDGKKVMAEWVDKGSASGLARTISTVITFVLTIAIDAIGSVISAAHGPIKDAIGPQFNMAIRRIGSDLMTGSPITPDMWDGQATQGFSAAMEMGIDAHALAAACEMFHPAKELGFPQMAAAYADLAAFAPMVANSTAVLIKAAIGRPAMYYANHVSRSQLPDVRDWVDAYTRGFIKDTDLRTRLEFEGWTDEAITAYLPVPFRRPMPRDPALLLEDDSIDEDWLATTLRHGGYADEDIPFLVKSLRQRGQKTAKSSLIGEAKTCYRNGTLDETGLVSILTELHVIPETQEIMLRAARLQRAAQIATEMKSSYKTLVLGNAIGIEDYQAILGALGLSDDIVSAEVAQVKAKLDVKSLKDEEAAAKTEIRKEQQLTAEMLARQVRLGAILPTEMEQGLITAGFEPDLAHSMAALAGLNTMPTPKLPTTLSAEAAQQKLDEIQYEAILTNIQKGALDATMGQAALIFMGMDPETATSRILLAQARGYKAPSVPKAAKIDPAIAKARTIKEQTAVAAFRAGEIDETGLRQQLAAAGEEQIVIDAIVGRELAKIQIAADQQLNQFAAQTEQSALTV